MSKASRSLLNVKYPPHLHRSMCAVCKAAENGLHSNNSNYKQSVMWTNNCSWVKSITIANDKNTFHENSNLTKYMQKRLSFTSLTTQTTKREMWERAFLQWLHLPKESSVLSNLTKIEQYNVEQLELIQQKTLSSKVNIDAQKYYSRGAESHICQSEELNSIHSNDLHLQKHNTNCATESNKFFYQQTYTPPRYDIHDDLISNKKMINIPITLHIPIHNFVPPTCIKFEQCDNTTIANSHLSPTHTCSFTTTASSDNEHFLTKLYKAGLTQSEINKQLQFQQTLLDFKYIVESISGIRFFLACGTALAAHREGYFIKHDDDIDIGILYNDLIAQGMEESTNSLSTSLTTKTVTTTRTTKNDKSVNSTCKSTVSNEDNCHTKVVTNAQKRCVRNDVIYAQSVLYKMLNALMVDNLFVIFDICGELSKGLEVRILHRKTNVKLDINVYYPPLERPRSDTDGNTDKMNEDKFNITCNNKNENNVNESCFANEEYVWCGTYYEDSHRRKHKMYRYKHAPFAHALKRLHFCDKLLLSSTSLHVNNKSIELSTTPGFWVPPQSYLAENYGDDWMTPRVITYHDGVHGQYPNIIKEEEQSLRTSTYKCL